MEIIIALVVAAGLVYWFFFRKSEVAFVEAAPVVETASYKVPEPAATTPIPLVVETPAPVVEAVVEAAPVVEVVEAAPAKKPRKPRAPKVEATPVKAPVKAKPATKAKAPVKAPAKKAAAIAVAKKPRVKKS
jgi:hypothetical protein